MWFSGGQGRACLAFALVRYAADFAEATSILFTDATIIAFDINTNRTQTLRDSSILVENDSITQIYNGTTPTSYPNGTEVVNATGKIISPGFIDSHHHLWQTAFKTIASNTTLSEYFQKYSEFSPTITNMTVEDKYLGTLTGALELLNAGSTTVLDHAHGDSSNATADAMLNATLASGIRAYHGFTVHAIPGYDIEDQIFKLQELAQDPRLKSNGLVSLGLSYDGFDGGSENITSKLFDIVQNDNLSVVTTHYLGGPWTISNSPTLLSTLGWLNTSVPIIFSHASFITSSDFTALRQSNQYLSTTPESEMHYGHAHPWAHLIQDQASLGVDTHFTYSTDMVGQARLWLQRLRQRRFDPVIVEDLQIPIHNPMSVEQAFYLITRAGALSLRRSDLGIITPGAKADLIVFDGESPNMLGWKDPVAAIILHSNVGDVEHVLVGGEWVKRDGKLTFEGYGDVKRRFLESARRIQNTWAEIDFGSWSEGLFNGVTEYGEPEVVDTMKGDGSGY